MKTLAFIPARSGSKGIPNKNIKLLSGRPLITYSVESACLSDIDIIVISTDSADIFSIAQLYVKNHFPKRLSSLVWHHRPSNISGDCDVISTAIVHFFSVNLIDNVSDFVILQPTSPIRKESDINLSLEILKSQSYCSVISVCDPLHHPREVLIKKNNSVTFLLDHHPGEQRQQYEKMHFINGSIYAYKKEYYLKNPQVVYTDSFLLEMDQVHSVDIDSIDDFYYADYLITRLLESNLPVKVE
jgi:CMP-N,N'-diacetyllegionaminic acid synthase